MKLAICCFNFLTISFCFMNCSPEPTYNSEKISNADVGPEVLAGEPANLSETSSENTLDIINETKFDGGNIDNYALHEQKPDNKVQEIAPDASLVERDEKSIDSSSYNETQPENVVDNSVPDSSITVTLGRGLVLSPQVAYESTVLASSAPPGSSSQNLPAAVDLSSMMPPIRSQGSQGSCVGWAVGYGLKSYHEKVERGWTYSNSTLMSPAYVFNQIKSSNNCNGSQIIKALSLLRQQGVSTWQEMPYISNSCSAAPSQSARSNAVNHKIAGFTRIPHSVSSFKFALFSKKPIILAIKIYDNFYLNNNSTFQEYKNKGKYDQAKGVFEGHHAILLVGYDNSKNAFKLYNSWGSGWADNGYIWVDYNTLMFLTVEAYTTTDVTAKVICKFNYRVCENGKLYSVDTCNKRTLIKSCQYGCDSVECKPKPPCGTTCPYGENTKDSPTYYIILGQ